MNEAADFKSAVSTYSTTQALTNHYRIVKQKCPAGHPSRAKLLSRLPGKCMEARAGVEPTYTDLQSGA
jgi:hypothetical protein